METLTRRELREGSIVIFLCDEHIDPAFGKVLEAYGHSCVWIADRPSWRGKPDHWHLEVLKYIGADLYFSLDWNRQPDVWSEVYGRLASGEGRMVRLKPRGSQTPDVPTLTAYWARPYIAKLSRWLSDPRCVLLQVGMQITRQVPEVGGARAFHRQDVARMTQQVIHVHQNQLRIKGSARLNPPRGRGRP